MKLIGLQEDANFNYHICNFCENKRMESLKKLDLEKRTQVVNENIVYVIVTCAINILCKQERKAKIKGEEICVICEKRSKTRTTL